MSMSMNSQTGQHTGTKGCSLSEVGALSFKCGLALSFKCKLDVSALGYSSTFSASAIDSCHGCVPLTGDVHVGE